MGRGMRGEVSHKDFVEWFSSEISLIVIAINPTLYIG